VDQIGPRIRPEELFHFDDRGKGTRGHSVKLVKVRYARGTVEDIFSNKVTERWNQLDQEGQSMRPASTHLKVN